LAKFSQELIRRHKERILLKDAADDNHGMGSHDVNHRVYSVLRCVFQQSCLATLVLGVFLGRVTLVLS